MYDNQNTCVIGVITLYESKRILMKHIRGKLLPFPIFSVILLEFQGPQNPT